MNNTACNGNTQTAVVENRPTRQYVPAVDVYETPQEVVLTVDVPGSKSDQIDVHYEDGELRLTAPVAPRYGEDRTFLLQEYAVGDYTRTFRLGENLDTDKIEASYKDGVLTVRLPKVAASQPRRIAVNPG